MHCSSHLDLDIDLAVDRGSLAAIAATTSFTVEELEAFDKILKAASLPNEKRIILTTLNQAWASSGSMLDHFLESFRDGNRISWLLQHVVIIAMDEPSHKRCLAIHGHCFQMTSKGVDFSAQEKQFMSKDYLKMTREKIMLMGIVLRMGFSFIFTDGDVMWFRDPFQHFTPDADLELSCDYFFGNASDMNNAPNTGFFHARSNQRTIRLYKFWYDSHETFPGRHDQDVFKAIKGTKTFQDLGLKVRFLPTQYFEGFCAPVKNFDKVSTVHANCCVGLQKKLQDLTLLREDWKRYKLAHEKVEWRVPKHCKLK
ncbi:uncharacterized protein At4g15970-like [Selaginella moellendorffii]|uniref:uncharacterized protein At4g15970-like n=1 Tax=Selaginella moellendorffii TaxID=88036 RepID=UPI000D1CC650|nr:uncharacterized protein At4g15970-like [Selaginella moellendorffii]|eukprot:XP_024535219.1 uncharacterized protein At4g15970-like [Selaginella moellendorffii]